MVSADDETSACSAHNNNVDLGASSGTTVTGSKNSNTDDVSEAAAARDLQKRHMSPARMSRSDVVMHARPYSMTFAECGSESFIETGNGWPEQDWLMQKRVEKTIAGDQPAITQS